MGWSQGKGLGVDESGSIDPVHVSYKWDNKGMGYKGADSDEAVAQQKDFNALLATLSCDSQRNRDESTISAPVQSSPKSLELKSQKSRARVHYFKFTRGKDLSRASSKDLACILGTPAETKPFAPVEAVVVPDVGPPIDQVTDNTFGIPTIERGSINDYFMQKFKEKKRKSTFSETSIDNKRSKLINGVENLNGAKETGEESVSSKKKKRNRKKDINTETGDLSPDSSIGKSEILDASCTSSTTKGKRKSVTWGDVEVSFVSKYIKDMVDTSNDSLNENSSLEVVDFEGMDSLSVKKKKKEKKKKKPKNSVSDETPNQSNLKNSSSNSCKNCTDPETSLVSDDSKKKKKKSRNSLFTEACNVDHAQKLEINDDSNRTDADSINKSAKKNFTDPEIDFISEDSKKKKKKSRTAVIIEACNVDCTQKLEINDDSNRTGADSDHKSPKKIFTDPEINFISENSKKKKLKSRTAVFIEACNVDCAQKLEISYDSNRTNVDSENNSVVRKKKKGKKNSESIEIPETSAFLSTKKKERKSEYSICNVNYCLGKQFEGFDVKIDSTVTKEKQKKEIPALVEVSLSSDCSSEKLAAVKERKRKPEKANGEECTIEEPILSTGESMNIKKKKKRKMDIEAVHESQTPEQQLKTFVPDEVQEKKKKKHPCLPNKGELEESCEPTGQVALSTLTQERMAKWKNRKKSKNVEDLKNDVLVGDADMRKQRPSTVVIEYSSSRLTQDYNHRRVLSALGYNVKTAVDKKISVTMPPSNFPGSNLDEIPGYGQTIKSC